MTLRREDIHTLIDQQLDEWGINGSMPYKWATLTFTFTFENSILRLTAKERETQKELVTTNVSKQ